MTQPPEASAIDDAHERLVAENLALKARLDAATKAAGPDDHRHHRWRTAVSILLIGVGALLAPAALVAAWAAAELSDTERFVATLEPLADDPEVQAYLTDEVVTLVDNRVDIDGLTQDVFDGLADLGLPPRAASALDALAPAAADGLRGLLRDVVERLVASDGFAELWEQALQRSHTQVVGLLTDQEGNVLTVDSSGVLGVQLAPLLERLKSQLEGTGFPFADQIPVVDATIPLTTLENIDSVRAAYNITVLLGRILPWVSIGLLAIGVLVANHKPRALAGAGISLGVAMLLTMFLGAVGRTLFIGAVSPDVIPGDVARTVYDAVLTFVYSVALAVAILAFIVGLTGLLLGRARWARAVRNASARGFNSVRRLLYERGPLNERFGLSVYHARVWVRAVIIVGGVVVLLLSRPLTSSVVIVTAIVVLVLLAILTALERRPDTVLAETVPVAG